MNVLGILLDIEGTTSSISFVYDVMFPYVRSKLLSFLQADLQRSDVQSACNQIAVDAGYPSYSAWLGQLDIPSQSLQLATHILGLMDRDQKLTGLKALQGLIWEEGFRTGQLIAQLYPDVEPALRRWSAHGKDMRIFSSGSIVAQKLFFGHTVCGDLLSLFQAYYDTTIGSKKERDSYLAIAREYQLDPQQILFVSDSQDELQAASSAGMQVAASCRPGNAGLSANCPFQRIESFDQLDLLII